jgi:hypothetical protein
LGTLANALSPALTSLVNLGYTDVVRMPDGSYVRTLDQAGDPTAFMSFPDVNWAQVPSDIFNQLIKGFQKEFFSGNPTPGTPNAITGVFKLLSSILGGGGFGGLGGIGDLINAVIGGMNPLGASPLAANALPAAESKTVAVSTNSGGPAGNNAAPAYVPNAEDTGGGTEAEKDAEVKPSTTTKPSISTPKPAGPSFSPKPGPVGSVVGGVTSTVGGVTGGVASTVGGVTGGVTNTVGGVTGGVANTVGGLTGGLTGAVSGALGGS